MRCGGCRSPCVLCRCCPCRPVARAKRGAAARWGRRTTPRDSASSMCLIRRYQVGEIDKDRPPSFAPSLSPRVMRHAMFLRPFWAFNWPRYWHPLIPLHQRIRAQWALSKVSAARHVSWDTLCQSVCLQQLVCLLGSWYSKCLDNSKTCHCGKTTCSLFLFPFVKVSVIPSISTLLNDESQPAVFHSSSSIKQAPSAGFKHPAYSLKSSTCHVALQVSVKNHTCPLQVFVTGVSRFWILEAKLTLLIAPKLVKPTPVLSFWPFKCLSSKRGLHQQVIKLIENTRINSPIITCETSVCNLLSVPQMWDHLERELL